MVGNLLPPTVQPLVVSVYLIFQVSLSFVVVADVPDKGLAVLGCIISPMLQLQMVLHMAFIQKFFGTKLGFGDFGRNLFPGISLGMILACAIPMALFYALVILYLWPYKIETDPENPLQWYYPVTPAFWCKRPGKCCSRVAAADKAPSAAPQAAGDLEMAARVPTEMSMMSSN